MSGDETELERTGVVRESHGEAEAELRLQAQKLGKVGALFGTPDNAVLYIAGSVLIIVLSLLGALMFVDENLRPDIATTIGAIGLAALGYLGGLLKK